MPTLDPAILRAIPQVRSKFEDTYHRPRKQAYYIGQLQVILENDFFSWIAYNATMELVKAGYLSFQVVNTKHADKVTFVYHHSFTGKMDTRLKNIAKLIDKYSNHTVAEALGRHLEGLVRAELRAQGFTIISTNAREYKGRRWTKTNHNLDLIAEHSSGRLNVGIEVKNTLSMPEREEIETKIELCHYLGLTPVFATRWIKPYVELIRYADGFSWFFKTQIYPPGFDKLTQEIWKKLKLPVTVRTDLPQKSIEILSRWISQRTQIHE